MNKFKELREWLNLALTIVGGILIYVANMKLDNQRLTINAETAEKYQTKAEAQSFQAMTNAKLDSISADLQTIRVDLARMQGRDSARPPKLTDQH